MLQWLWYNLQSQIERAMTLSGPAGQADNECWSAAICALLQSSARLGHNLAKAFLQFWQFGMLCSEHLLGHIAVSVLERRPAMAGMFKHEAIVHL